MKTIHDDLLATQTASSVQPAISCIFTSRDGGTTYDYSFNPLVTTNRMTDIEYRQEPGDEYAIIQLRNNDLAVPDLPGYYVDLGWGANTATGLRYGTYPRLWVKKQVTLSGGVKGQKPNLVTILELQGVSAILKEQYIFYGNSPYQDSGEILTGKTIYGIIENLIESWLETCVNLGLPTPLFDWTLDPLGDQNDTVIDTLIPEPTHDPDDPFLNAEAPVSFETIADVIGRLLKFTGCYLRAKDGLAFKIVYPQASDAVNETYYSTLTTGHVFYEDVDRKYVKIPNRVRTFSKVGDTWDNYIEGEAHTDDYDMTFPGTYSGEYLPVTEIHSDSKGWVTDEQTANKLAKFILDKYQAETFGGRIIVPHDARVELYDRVAVIDTRGT